MAILSPHTAPIHPSSWFIAPSIRVVVHAPSDAYDCVLLRAQTAPRHASQRARWHKLNPFTDAAKGCRRCCKTHGSLCYCRSSSQSKSRLIIVAVIERFLLHHYHHQSTPAASPTSNLSSPATLTTTNTSHLLFYHPALNAISIACALSDHSPLFLPSPSSFSLHSLPQRHQSYHSHIRNDG